MIPTIFGSTVDDPSDSLAFCKVYLLRFVSVTGTHLKFDLPEGNAETSVKVWRGGKYYVRKLREI